MNYVSCLNPHVVYNRHLRRNILVPCGQCDACISNKGLKWVNRINDEFAVWSNVLFFTLTYADSFLPRLDFCNKLLVHSNDLSSKYGSNKFVELSKVLQDSNDYEFINVCRDVFGFIPALSHSDITQFINNFKNLYKYDFKYFISGEYGPTTKRPHYHGLLFFNPRECEYKQHVDSVGFYLSQSWSRQFSDSSVQLGFVDIKECDRGTSRYVSAYCNCTSNLPTVLKYFPNFSVKSKCGLGFTHFSYNQIYSFVKHAIIHYISEPDANNEPSVELIPYGLFTKWFARPYGFDTINIGLRVALLGFVLSQRTASHFVDVYRHTQYDTGDILWHLHHLLFDSAETDSSLSSFYYACVKIKKTCKTFCLDYYSYWDCYDRCRSAFSLAQLSEFYKLQVTIADDPFCETEFINALYVYDDVLQIDPLKLPVPVASPDYFYYLRLENCKLYDSLSRVYRKILIDTTKVKKKNDFLSTRVKQFQNVF